MTFYQVPVVMPDHLKNFLRTRICLQGSSWDRVLLDAPCSGTGVLCKRADLRWRRSPEDMKQLVELQVGDKHNWRMTQGLACA